jgi:hypothetical protein
MKKVFLMVIVSLLAFVSCECPFEEWRETQYSYEDGGINYDGDVLRANMIYGTWGTIGCNPVGYEFKQIRFYRDGECDVVLSFPGSNDWRTETWTYYFVRNTFTLDRGDSYTVFRFTVRKFIYPELYVQDSFSQSQYSKCWVWKKN